jgi:hypothetical protein
VELKQTNVESKLLLPLLLCGFDIYLFLFDRTAKIDPTEFSTCRGSFGGLNPHVFNLTGQLESKPLEFPTLAATDLRRNEKNTSIDNFYYSYSRLNRRTPPMANINQHKRRL